MSAGDAGRWCRSVAVRLAPDADVAAVRRALALAGQWVPEDESAGGADGGRMTDGEPSGGGRLWTQDVPAGAGSPEGDRWRERELDRAVDPAVGPASRAVLLRYADGQRDLVVVTHDAPDQVPTRAAPPDWSLGSGGSGAVAWCPVPSAPASGSAALTGVTAAEIVAALGMALARYTGQDRVLVGLHPGRVVALDAGPEVTTGAYRMAVDGALSGACGSGHGAAALGGPDAGEGSPPVAGVAEWLPAAGATDFDVVACRAFLEPPYPLSVAVHGDEVRLAWRAGEVAVEVAYRFAAHLAAAYARLREAGPDRTLGEIDILDAGDHRTITELGGLGARAPLPPPGLIHRAVEERVRQAPDAVAVCAPDGRLTYRELDARADRVAAALRRRGVAAGTRVGVCLDRSAQLVAVLLGVLKAGAAYVPMDPAYPAQRLEFIARDAGLALLVTAGDQGGDVRTAHPDDLTTDGDDAPAGVTPDGAAYVIYTSGSTGLPKGVAVPHGNVTRLLDATRADFGLAPGEVWTWFHSVAFDFSVWEIWGCLMTGGRLVVVPYPTSRDPDAFAALLATERVTVLAQTPSAFTQLMDVDRDRPLPASLRLVVFGGEPLDAAPLRSWFDRHPEATCRLVNMYGITETTVHVTAHPLTRADALTATRSVGRPIPGWHVYVMDRHGRLAPPGVAGEIYVGGAGVASGYVDRPELTAARFRPDPYGGGTMYRTGDLGRLRPDGYLDHLGRVDSQVQLRGHRVELGEVRARLLDAPGVRAAAVVVRGDPADPVAARLDAYVVGDAEPEDVRRHAAGFLPDYMVPATVTRLPALPLTANGKVDEARLPEPAGDAPDTGPGGDESVMGTVHAAWERVFGFRVGPDDDFFSLGGNSLIAVRLLAALRAAGLPRVGVPQLYRNRTVTRLADLLAGPAVPTTVLEAAR